MGRRRGSGRATINDVAKHAQVGAITVSRMLRDPSKVSPELRQRIQDAIAALNYVPDPKARALASGRSNVIAVIVPSLSNIVFSDVLRGIQDVIADTGYQVQIGNTRYSSDEEDRLINLFLSQQPAGVIVTGLDQSPNAHQQLRDAGVPVVQIMETGRPPIDAVIGFSHDVAAEAVAGHILAQGYRNPGFIAARMDPRVERRHAGFQRGLEAGGCMDTSRIATTRLASSVTVGRHLMAELLSRHGDVDAVFCANDDLALGALFECQSRGIRVPEDMGIVGFNDLEMMAAACPSLTSVRTGRYRIGQRAAEYMAQRLKGDAEPGLNEEVVFELVGRESTDRSGAAVT